MEQTVKYLIIITSLMTIKLNVIESKNDTKPKIYRRQVPMFINVCKIEDRRAKVHCYCDSSKPKTAVVADCWVFSGGITEDDPIWPSFSSQSEIEHLTFNVRSDDTLTFIPAKSLVRLDRLKHLTIQYGTITKIPPYAITNSSSIKHIVLKANRITQLEKHAFAQMMMLTNLSLDDNQIAELKRDVFFNLPNLHILHLSNNNISLIHEGCFKHLNNLIELKLDSNYISVITREMFEGLENLSRLSLRYNRLSMIGNLVFSDSWGLKELWLDNNAIEFISERAFGGLAQLVKLSLNANKITTLYEDVFQDTKSLIMLDLKDNLLNTMSYETIRTIVENEVSTTTSLHLEGNPFSCDCRLSWIYILRNETKSNRLRLDLSKITCILETKPKVTEDEKNDQNSLIDVTYDYYDKNEDVAKAVKFVDIPIEELSCPKELMQTIEESFGPIPNEIRLKAYSSVRTLISSPVILVIFVLILVL